MPLPRTQAEADAHNARVAAGRIRATLSMDSAPPYDDEALAKALHRSPAPAPHVAGTPDGQEDTLHAQIASHCVGQGWYFVHSRTDRRTTQAKGVPDFLIFGENRQFWAVEVKTKTGKVTREQAGAIFWLDRLGHKAAVVRSFQEFLELVTGSNRLPEHVRD